MSTLVIKEPVRVSTPSDALHEDSATLKNKDKYTLVVDKDTTYW